MPQIKLKGKGPIAIGILLEMPGNKLLCQLRDNKKEIHYPGFWSIFTGGLDDADWDGDINTSLKTGILRELGEELDFISENGQIPFSQISDLKLFDEFVFKDDSCDYADYQYVFHAKVNVDFDKLFLKEGQKLGLFSEEEIKNLDIAPSYRGVVMKFFESNRKKEGGLNSSAKPLLCAVKA